MRTTVLSPSLKRSLLAVLKAVPHACGWCRTRWSCATVALELKARRGVEVSAETVRRWFHEVGWVWQRAKFADELDIPLLPKVGYQWMPKAEQVEVLTPGTNEKCYLAGALAMRTGTIAHCVGYRKTQELFLELLKAIDRVYPLWQFTRLYVVVDNYKIHKAKAVEKWLASHPQLRAAVFADIWPQSQPD